MLFFKKSFWRTLYRAFCNMLGNQPSLGKYLEPILQTLYGSYHSELFRGNVVALNNVTCDMLTITLNVPRNWGGFEAGQHVMLTHMLDGKYVSRPFSISSSEFLWSSQRQIQISCKVKSNGELTSSLNSLNAGETLFLSAAQGQFVLPKRSADVILLCAGSGITPMRAYLQSLADLSQHAQLPFPNVTLLYRYRGAEHAAFLTEFRDLQETHNSFRLIESDSLQSQKLSTQLTEIGINHNDYYVCGPLQFMQSVITSLKSQGIAAAQIHQEHFGPSLIHQFADSTLTNDTDPAAYFQAGFYKAGRQHEVAASANASLLDSALQGGVEPTFGCRMGVCFQCVCNKLSGQVKDLRTGELSGLGQEQIQLCVSAPVSDVTFEY
ncbi:iron-sulfur cluster-binding domain-containing protein [Aliiglaciecola litoralis]